METVSRREVVRSAVVGTAAVVAGGLALNANAQESKGDVNLTEESSGYEKVAQVIGEEVNKAYVDILKRLASGETSFAGTSFAEDDLKSFFKLLGATALTFDFQAKKPKPQQARYFPAIVEIDSSLIDDSSLISGEISIGGTIRF